MPKKKSTRKKNTGKRYEKITQKIFQLMLRQQAVHNVTVQHDIELQGKLSKHQIDVYWEYELSGIKYRTVVQCKDWGSAVKQEQLFAFHCVLNDLPGQPRGVVVGRSFQSGAKGFANANDIILYELREPDAKNMTGLIQRVTIQMNLYAPRIENAQLIPDIAWVSAEGKRLGIQKGYTQHFGGTDVWLVDDEGERKWHSKDLGPLLLPECGVEVERTHRRHDFAEGRFLETPGQPFQRVKIAAVEADVSLTLHQRTISVDASPFITHVLQSVFDHRRVLLTTDDTIKLPDKDDCSD